MPPPPLLPSQLITHGPDRASALDRMRAALDAYVIRGVGHNIPFLRDLCDHPRFAEGRLSTGFIKDEYPGGFTGVQLTPAQTEQVVGGAALMNVIRQYATRQLSGRSEAAPPPEVSEVVITLGTPTAGPDGKPTGPPPPTFAVTVQLALSGAGDASESALPDIEPGAETWALSITKLGPGGPEGAPSLLRMGSVDWSLDDPLFLADLPDVPASAPPSASTLRLQQVARTPEGFTLLAYGATVDVAVRTRRAWELAGHMLPKRARDLSRVLASPMPGTLVSLAVAPGSEVEEGQEVAVVEAMKMQNVLRAPKKGRVKSVAAKAGQTLAVDQVRSGAGGTRGGITSCLTRNTLWTSATSAFKCSPLDTCRPPLPPGLHPTASPPLNCR